MSRPDLEAEWAAKIRAVRVRNVACPDHLVGGLVRYVVYGIRPGSGLQAALENNLMRTIERCDQATVEGIAGLVGAIYNALPGLSHGSPSLVQGWIDSGGESRR